MFNAGYLILLFSLFFPTRMSTLPLGGVLYQAKIGPLIFGVGGGRLADVA